MNNLKFTSTHEWLAIGEDAIMTVGITHHAQQLLGDMVFIELPDEGKNVAQGEELGVVESVKAASDFYAPISGTVLAVNTTARENPAIVNSDPLGMGWLVKIKANNSTELENLLNAEQYQNLIIEDH